MAHAEAWPEASMLFRRDPRWVGGDGAYSVPLGGDRVLWLFGDSFIARGDKRQADDSVFIRNSLAIQTGLDPTRAFISFYWSNGGGGPQSFVPEADNGDFFWPGHGAVIDGVGRSRFAAARVARIHQGLTFTRGSLMKSRATGGRLDDRFSTRNAFPSGT